MSEEQPKETTAKVKLFHDGTLIVRLPEDILEQTERVILDCGFWSKTFCEDEI